MITTQVPIKNMHNGCAQCKTLWSIGVIAFTHVEDSRKPTYCKDCSYKIRRTKEFKDNSDITYIFERIEIIS